MLAPETKNPESHPAEFPRGIFGGFTAKEVVLEANVSD